MMEWGWHEFISISADLQRSTEGKQLFMVLYILQSHRQLTISSLMISGEAGARRMCVLIRYIARNSVISLSIRSSLRRAIVLGVSSAGSKSIKISLKKWVFFVYKSIILSFVVVSFPFLSFNLIYYNLICVSLRKHFFTIF